MEYTTTVDIASDIDTVWRAVSDPATWPTWMESVTSIEPAAAVAEPGYGAEYTIRQKWWKLNDQTIQIREFDAPHRFAYAATTTAGEVAFAYTLRPLDDGRVAVDHELTMDSLYAKVNGLLSGSAYEKELVKEATQLRDHCERTAPQDVRRD